MTAGKVVATFIDKTEVNFISAAAMENDFLEFFRQLVPGRLQAKAIMLRQRTE